MLEAWRASAVSLVGVAVVVGVLLTLFGNMFVQQMIAMVRGLPAMYEQIREFVDQYATFKMPEISNLGMEIFNNIQTSWVTDFAGTAMSTVGGLFSFLLNLMTVVMTTYYISAAGPKLRRSFCQWLAPNTQRRFLLVWTVAQGQISSFLFSRSILALINATCTAIFLEILHVPTGCRWPCSAAWYPSSSPRSAPISAARCRCCSLGATADGRTPWRCWCSSSSTSRSRT